MKELLKQLKVIEEKWGLKAYEEILGWANKVQMNSDEVTKSRDKWRKKYENLRDERKAMRAEQKE